MINGINSINPLNNVQETRKSEGISKARATESDSISVSKEAEKMAEAYYLDKVAAETPDVRADRVAEVREKIKDPSYLNDAVFGSAADKFLTAQKKKIDTEKRSLKKLENSRNNMLDTLKRKGIKDMADLEKKVGEYQHLAIIASNNMDNAAEMFDTYYKQAVEDNEKNKINLLPLKDQVEAYTKEIRDNLHPMDEAWKAMLREENEKQFKKSIPLFLIKGGRFLIRK